MDRNIDSLIAKYRSGTLTKEEEEWIQGQLDIPSFQKKVKEHFFEHYQNRIYDDKRAYETFLRNIANKEDGRVVPLNKTIWNRRYILRIAAVFVGLFITSYFLFFQREDTTLINTPPKATADQVTLQLEDGREIVLHKSESKTIKGNEDGYAVVQNSGKLTYGNQDLKGKTIYNTLDVPLGKQFELELSDGTHVYLNAGSRLRFPVSFSGQKIRQLQLQGEAYFKVAPNKGMPFVVNSKGLSSEVFGTEFYISNYDNEESKVVLVEGSVGVFAKGERYNTDNGVLLSPSQLAKLENRQRKSKEITVENVDTSRYTAWINGTLLFKNERFADLVKKLERHYNVTFTIEYTGLQDKRFTGKFDVEPIEEILEVFSRTNAFKYTIEKDQITITK